MLKTASTARLGLLVSLVLRGLLDSRAQLRILALRALRALRDHPGQLEQLEQVGRRALRRRSRGRLGRLGLPAILGLPVLLDQPGK